MPEEPSRHPALPFTRSDGWILALLTAATWACYAHTLGFQFVYDDKILILQNPALLSWRSIPHYFTESFVAPVAPHAPANYYRPVLLIWMLVNQKLWHYNPLGWHVAAVLIESLAVAGFYLLARHILGERRGAGVAAAIFALHPLHVECVAWVMAVAEPWVAMLLFGAFLCHFRGRRAGKRSGVWAAAAAALFALAALSKEDALVFPALVLVYEWVFAPAPEADGRLRMLWTRGWGAVARTAVFWAVAAGYFAARLAALHGFSHTGKWLATSTVLLTLPSVIWKYFRLLAWPVGISPFYDLPYATAAGFFSFWLPLAGVVGALAALAAWARKSRPAAFAAAWLLLPLLPLLDLGVFPAGEIVHDRYLFMPTAGLALLAALGLRRLRTIGGGGSRAAGLELAVALPLAALLAAGTVYYGRFWSDNMTLYRRGLAMAPGNNLVANNLGDEYVERGQFHQAVALFRTILAREPDSATVNYDLGYCFYKLGRLEDARHFLRRAIALNPSNAVAYLAYAQTNLKMGNLDTAETAARRALALNPQGRGYHFALGIVLRARGKLAQALAEFHAESHLFPHESAARTETEGVERELRRAAPHSGAAAPHSER